MSGIEVFEAGHIGLNVSNLQQSQKFYREVFDFDLISESKEDRKIFAFLGKGQKTILTLWQQSSGRFDRNISGLHHLAFRVNSIDAVRTVEQKLKKLGAKLIYDGIVPHREGAESGGVFFEDPDGIRLEIYAPESAAEYTAPSDAPSCGFF